MIAATPIPLRGAEKAKHAIREWIRKNKPRRHDKFFSQRELAKLLDVDPMTAHKALRQLSEEGVLYRQRGRGSFIGPAPITNRGLRMALIMPGADYDDPDMNPDNWHMVQRHTAAIMRAMNNDDTFSVVVLSVAALPADSLLALALPLLLRFGG